MAVRMTLAASLSEPFPIRRRNHDSRLKIQKRNLKASVASILALKNAQSVKIVKIES
jgi:hypothetical protein